MRSGCQIADDLGAAGICETRGFMKMLLDAKSDRILGFTMLGALPYSMLRDAILTHPTIAEGLNVLLTSGFK